MNEFLQRLKQRKLVQWAIAYVAAAVLLQGTTSSRSSSAGRKACAGGITLALVVGFFVALALALVSRGTRAQKVSVQSCYSLR